MNTKKLLILLSITAAVAMATPAHAKGQKGSAGEKGLRDGSSQMQRIQERVRDPASCDGTGERAALKDGSGKADRNKGNPKGTGTPLKDGSGGGRGQGRGAGVDCPNG